LPYFHTKQAASSRRASHAVTLSSVLWPNQQTVAYLVLMAKSRNHRGDFETQITKS
jgi:hypothetical protein